MASGGVLPPSPRPFVAFILTHTLQTGIDNPTQRELGSWSYKHGTGSPSRVITQGYGMGRRATHNLACMVIKPSRTGRPDALRCYSFAMLDVLLRGARVQLLRHQTGSPLAHSCASALSERD